MKTRSNRVGHLLRSVVVLVSYLCVVLSLGHGAGLIGMLLVAGRAPEFVVGMAAGWLGIVALAASTLVASRHRVLAGLAGAAFLMVSWLAFLRVSEDRLWTIATSVPMFAAMAWYLYGTVNLNRGVHASKGQT